MKTHSNFPFFFLLCSLFLFFSCSDDDYPDDPIPKIKAEMLPVKFSRIFSEDEFVFEYDDQARIVKIKEFNNDNDRKQYLREERLIIYDDSSPLYTEDSLSVISSVEDRRFNSDGVLIETIIYAYNYTKISDNQVRIEFHDVIFNYFDYVYFVDIKSGRLLRSESHLLVNKKGVSSIDYIYDDEGNLIQEISEGGKIYTQDDDKIKAVSRYIKTPSWFLYRSAEPLCYLGIVSFSAYNDYWWEYNEFGYPYLHTRTPCIGCSEIAIGRVPLDFEIEYVSLDQIK